jgi:hypothetical protein
MLAKVLEHAAPGFERDQAYQAAFNAMQAKHETFWCAHFREK